MIIGVPKEIKNNENRVGMTPSGVAELVKRGHTVYIQHTAGENSGFQDEAYTAVGAQILPTMEETYAYGPDDSKSKRTYRTGVQTDPQRTVVVHLFPFRFR